MGIKKRRPEPPFYRDVKPGLFGAATTCNRTQQSQASQQHGNALGLWHGRGEQGDLVGAIADGGTRNAQRVVSIAQDPVVGHALHDSRIQRYRAQGELLAEAARAGEGSGEEGQQRGGEGDALPGEELNLWMSESGRLTFSPPLFHSPLGAPATYIAIELTANTKQAVTAAVQGLLPKLLPLGINPKTKEWVTTSTPLHDRIVDMADFETAFERITHPDFKSVQVVSPE